MDVAVEKLVYGGDGLARVEGQVMLLAYVLPGERVLASPERVKSGLLRGRATEVLETSPNRGNTALRVLRPLRRLSLSARGVFVPIGTEAGNSARDAAALRRH